MFLFSTRIVSSPQFTLRYFKENGQLVHRKVTHQTEITLTSSYSSHFANEGQSEGRKGNILLLVWVFWVKQVKLQSDITTHVSCFNVRRHRLTANIKVT